MQKQIIARFPNCGYGFIVEEYKSAAVGLSATIVTYGIAIVAAVLRKLLKYATAKLCTDTGNVMLKYQATVVITPPIVQAIATEAANSSK